MRKEYLNTKSGFYTGQYVKVKRVDTNETCSGIISTVYDGPINRAIPNGDHTDHIFIQFNGEKGRFIYTKWLSRGSPIYVNKPNNKKQKCVVCDIKCDDSGIINTIKVADDNGGISMPQTYYNINAKDIDSMLVWRIGYEILAE